VGQEKSRLNPTHRVVDQGLELLPLLVGNHSSTWHPIYTDKVAVLFERVAGTAPDATR
jgi:hypothetical protein